MSAVEADAPETPGLEPEVFLSQHRRILDWKRKAEEVGASGKSAIQAAKAMGINLKAYKLVLKWRDMDTGDVESLIRDALVYAKILNLGLFEQGDLFREIEGPIPGLTDKIVTDQKAWEAERDGYDAGKAGHPLDNCPHQPGTPFHQRWVVGYHDGEQERKAAEARGEKTITPRRASDDNPEDRHDD